MSDHLVARDTRILARRDRKLEPLILGAKPVGPSSPSPSLLVERFDLASTGWQEHLHVDQVLALYLTPGAMRQELEGEGVSEAPLAAGQTVICARSRHESLQWTGNVSFLCVRVSDSALDDAAAFLLGRERVELRAELSANDPRIMNLLYALEAERTTQYSAGRLFLDSMEHALASLLVAAHGTVASKPASLKGGLSPACLRRVLDFMHANLDRQVTLEDLATCAGLSASHFSHQFRASTRTAPHRYMLALRIERAKTMLRNPKLSVLEIALAAGFETQQHFATAFRRIAGVSPTTFRRQS